MHLYVLKCACHVYYSFGSRLRPKGLQTLLYLQEKWRTESSRVHPIEPNCPMNTHLKFKFKFKFKCFICHIHEHVVKCKKGQHIKGAIKATTPD